MPELTLITVFVIITMLMVMGFCLYIIRIVLGVSGKALPDSAETPFSSISEAGKDLSAYLNKMGGQRFTETATFPLNMEKTNHTPEDYPEGVVATDPSEIAIS